MFARVARYQIPEENLDAAVEGFREAIEEPPPAPGQLGRLPARRPRQQHRTDGDLLGEPRGARVERYAGKQAAIAGSDPARRRDPGGRPLRSRDRLLRALHSVRPQKKGSPRTDRHPRG